LEECVLTGTIVERQRDRATRRWKYVIHGRTLLRGQAAVVAKFGARESVVVLTVFTL
jgi:hypothetical protein